MEHFLQNSVRIIGLKMAFRLHSIDGGTGARGIQGFSQSQNQNSHSALQDVCSEEAWTTAFCFPSPLFEKLGARNVFYFVFKKLNIYIIINYYYCVYIYVYILTL